MREIETLSQTLRKKGVMVVRCGCGLKYVLRLKDKRSCVCGECGARLTWERIGRNRETRDY